MTAFAAIFNWIVAVAHTIAWLASVRLDWPVCLCVCGYGDDQFECCNCDFNRVDVCVCVRCACVFYSNERRKWTQKREKIYKPKLVQFISNAERSTAQRSGIFIIFLFVSRTTSFHRSPCVSRVPIIITKISCDSSTCIALGYISNAIQTVTADGWTKWYQYIADSSQTHRNTHTYTNAPIGRRLKIVIDRSKWLVRPFKSGLRANYHENSDFYFYFVAANRKIFSFRFCFSSFSSTSNKYLLSIGWCWLFVRPTNAVQMLSPNWFLSSFAVISATEHVERFHFDSWIV